MLPDNFITTEVIYLVMGFRNRGMALRPVHRIKHVYDKQGGVVLGNTDVNNVIVAVDAPVLANQSEVETGSKVNGVYLHVEVAAVTAGALANVYMIVAKNPGDNLTLPAPNLVGVNDNKRFVIHQAMIMLEQAVNGNPRVLFDGVIVIPRGYRRFGPNDRLEVNLLAPGVNINFCIQAHYKEFR